MPERGERLIPGSSVAVRFRSRPHRRPGGTFELLLVFQKPLARLERDRVDATLEGFRHQCILLEPGRRRGLFAK